MLKATRPLATPPARLCAPPPPPRGDAAQSPRCPAQAAAPAIWRGRTRRMWGAAGVGFVMRGGMGCGAVGESVGEAQRGVESMTTDEELMEADELALVDEVERLEALRAGLGRMGGLREKVEFLEASELCVAFRRRHGLAFQELLNSFPEESVFFFLVLVAIGQEHILGHLEGETSRSELEQLAEDLACIELFYDSLGGIVGYQMKTLELILAGLQGERRGEDGSNGGVDVVECLEPSFLDLSQEGNREAVSQAVMEGLKALPHFAEIYAVGGAGDRLGLVDASTGEPLPAALLRYCGRTMLDGLLRDVQAREYLYFKLFGTQPCIPIVLMTSDAKANHQKITGLLASRDWYGRGEDAFRIIKQPLVPVVAIESGRWLMSEPLSVVMKPGGHGVIWKLMQDHRVFDWLMAQEAVAALVRQISNPLAGTDTTLLALAGAGYSQGKAMGFASCQRVVGASEGMIVLRHETRPVEDAHQPSHRYGLTNIEYTEFERLGITDTAVESGSSTSRFPANTNILYIGLEAARQAVARGAAEGGGAALPGLIFNMKKKVKYYSDVVGKLVAERAGRMECMMQNLADSLADNMGAPLPVGRHDLLSTFMVHSQRRKVTSSAKRKRDPKATNLRQTPEGSFWDLMANARDVLSLCGVDTPELTPVQEYLSTGPSFIFLFHPALGPLWEVVAQKIQGGALTRGSELVLEVAEARLHNVVVDGSLLVEADDVMGHMAVAAAPTPTVGARNGDGPVGDSTGISRDDWTESPSASDDSTSGRDEDAGPSTNGSFARPEDSGAAERRLVFGCGCGRVWMENVRIRNRGVDWTNPGNVYWKCEVARHQAARVVLRGRSEFSAVDVEIDGDQVFEVPHGCRMDVRGDGRGGFVATLASVDEPSWEWTYEPREDGGVRLELLQERGRC